ncbi:Di/tri peptide transporter 2 [Paraphaeosphaeria sporulosa]
MELHGLPNDILYSFRLLIESGIIHLLRTVVYPFLAKHKINQGRIARLLLRHIGHCMGYHRSAHHLQCWAFLFDPPFLRLFPRRYDRVMSQFPAYFLFALSEALAIAAGEYAYTQAPKSMKSLVAALNLFTVAVASALGIAVSRAAVSPHLTVSTYTLTFPLISQLT